MIESMNCLSDEALLGAAEAMYRIRGVLPLNVVADLMARGFEVERLEQQWEASVNEPH